MKRSYKHYLTLLAILIVTLIPGPLEDTVAKILIQIGISKFYQYLAWLFSIFYLGNKAFK